jgi:hypothetical protein
LKRWFTIKNAKQVGQRIPSATMHSLKVSAKSFISSSAVMVPIGLVMTYDKKIPVSDWLKKGVMTGTEWAKMGAYYAV